MRLLFIADGRSPTALNWMEYFVDKGDEVHLVSLFPCAPKQKLASVNVIPVAFSRIRGGSSTHGLNAPARPGQVAKQGNRSRLASLVTPEMRNFLRHWFVPVTLLSAAKRLRLHLDEIQPDLIHAMRIPYEGMLAGMVEADIPLVISVWGNDFSLHAPANRMMRSLTMRALQRVDGLHTDCRKDLRLARLWGYEKSKFLVIPGAGGIRRNVFYPKDEETDGDETLPVIINPRGLRAYVRNDIFFEAVALVKTRMPKIRVLCPSMQGAAQAESWVRQFSLTGNVELLPKIPHDQMAANYRRAGIVVSPSTHDGTPNSLLEAIACDCFPVAGDIESIREWITPGVNGLLANPNDARELADAILEAVLNRPLRSSAGRVNRQIIRNRADYLRNMQYADAFYHDLL